MNQIPAEQTAVIAGNGPSLADIIPGTVLAEDFIVRTNSFFFEPVLHLGRRVDIAMIAGDPRVAPMVFETLWKCRNTYDMRHWSTQDRRVVKMGKRRFERAYVPMRYRTKAVKTDVERLCARYQRKPTTGTMAVVMAHGFGAQRIVVTGMDLYSSDRRYVFEPRSRYRALMGQDIGSRGMDTRLHSPNLDKAILTMLNKRSDVSILSASNNSVLSGILDTAPVRAGCQPLKTPHDAPRDWAWNLNLYPVLLARKLKKNPAQMAGF